MHGRFYTNSQGQAMAAYDLRLLLPELTGYLEPAGHAKVHEPTHYYVLIQLQLHRAVQLLPAADTTTEALAIERSTRSCYVAGLRFTFDQLYRTGSQIIDLLLFPEIHQPPDLPAPDISHCREQLRRFGQALAGPWRYVDD